MTLLRHRYLRYGAVSAAALAADSATFLTLIHNGTNPALAAMLGYLLGIGIHWSGSARFVFADSLRSGAQGQQQKLLFLVSSLVGLGVTVAIVSAGHAMGLDARISKAIAIVASFNLVWLVRRYLVFG